MTDGFGCYRADGQREHEPIPSSRDDPFISRTRFPFDDALKLAESMAPTMRIGTIHGLMTAAECWAREQSR
ncbi:MAG: hypothetical protein K2Y33_03295 [Mycolicibacterium frederiksbergense]|nr:hypothetical protein [Mycolicibacterium frederiksbergense]